MQTHSSGAIKGTRQGAEVVAQSFQLDFANNLTGVDIKLLTVEASATKPVGIRTRAVVVVADNSGTSATLSVGTAAAGTQILSAVDIKAAAGTNYAPTNNVIVVVADTDIYALKTLVGTAATAGKVAIFVELFEVNVNQAQSPAE